METGSKINKRILPRDKAREIFKYFITHKPKIKNIEIAERVGVAPNTISTWKYYNAPVVLNEIYEFEKLKDKLKDSANSNVPANNG